jgi:hypothetical protein
MLFEQAHLLAHRRRGNAEFFGGERKADMPGRCFERSQPGERGEATGHQG